MDLIPLERSNMMKENLRIKLALPLFVILIAAAAFAQQSVATKSSAPSMAESNVRPGASSNASAVELARTTVAAQGGQKFRELKSIVLTGSGDAYSPLIAQKVPIQFAIAITDERMRVDMKAPFGLIQLINDGQQFHTRMGAQQGSFGIAPPAKFGIRVLAKYDKPGYSVTPLPDQKKETGFRITDPEGNSTDFYLDSKSNRVSRYIYRFKDSNQTWETSDFREVEGLPVPYKITMQLGSRQGDYYAEFKVKEVKINEPLSGELFTPMR